MAAIESARQINNRDEFSRTYDSEDSEDSYTRTMARGKALVKSCEFKQDKPGATAPTGSGIGDESTDVQVIHNIKLQILDDKLETCIYLLGKLLTEVKDLKQRSASNNNGNSGLDLKLDTRDGVTAFEARLKTCKKFENEFIRKVKQVGGANGEEFIERALAIIFQINLQRKTPGKVILEKFPTWDKAEFSKAGTYWFRLGNQRAGEQPKQVTKKTTLADKNNQRSNENNE